jgi:hypothetical protein
MRKGVLLGRRRQAQEEIETHNELFLGHILGDQDPEASTLIIVELMSEHALHSLLPRGTKTWHKGEHESTIDLIIGNRGTGGGEREQNTN